MGEIAKPQLFFGTGNPKKLQEIQEILSDRYEIRSFRDLENPPDIEETEDTLQGNANLPFHHRVMSRLTRWRMTNGTTNVFNHRLKSIVLITIHRR